MTRVVLLPQADGSASGVVVRALTTDATTAAQVHASYPQLFATAPPRPSKYVLNFMPGGTTLTPESQAALPKILEDVSKRSGADLVVTGHTDTLGALLANDALSVQCDFGKLALAHLQHVHTSTQL